MVRRINAIFRERMEYRLAEEMSDSDEDNIGLKKHVLQRHPLVYTQAMRPNNFNTQAKSLTGFGPASAADKYFKYVDPKVSSLSGKISLECEQFSCVRTKPQVCTNISTALPLRLRRPVKGARRMATLSKRRARWVNKFEEHKKQIWPCLIFQVMFVKYCLSDDQRHLLASLSDDRGEMVWTTVKNINIPNRTRRKKVTLLLRMHQDLMCVHNSRLVQEESDWRGCLTGSSLWCHCPWSPGDWSLAASAGLVTENSGAGALFCPGRVSRRRSSNSRWSITSVYILSGASLAEQIWKVTIIRQTILILWAPLASRDSFMIQFIHILSLFLCWVLDNKTKQRLI